MFPDSEEGAVDDLNCLACIYRVDKNKPLKLEKVLRNFNDVTGDNFRIRHFSALDFSQVILFGFRLPPLSASDPDTPQIGDLGGAHDCKSP